MKNEIKYPMPIYLTPRDWLALHYRVTLRVKRLWVRLVVPILLTIISEIPYFPSQLDFAVTAANFSFLFVVWNICALGVFPFMLLFLRMRKQIFEHATSLQIDEEGIFAEQNAIEVKYPWNRLASIERDSLRFYFFVDENCAIIVPLRAFSSQSSSEDFYNEAQNYFKKNKFAK